GTASGANSQGSKIRLGSRRTQAALRPCAFAPMTSNGLPETSQAFSPDAPARLTRSYTAGSGLKVLMLSALRIVSKNPSIPACLSRVRTDFSVPLVSATILQPADFSLLSAGSASG